jgi:hypothetical protein|tara:strand:- start:3691 stop:3837 length:147 start_codon:yes stop_codon:yes gene_type:complete
MISEIDKKMITAYSRLFKQIADSGKPKKISKENKKEKVNGNTKEKKRI